MARDSLNRGPVCNGWWNSNERVLLHGHAVCPVHDRPAAAIRFGALPEPARQPKEDSNA